MGKNLVMEEIPAIILSGGLGTRLRAVVRDRPKVLAPVGGRPFLAYLLDQVEAAGVRRVVLCTGYLGEVIQERFGSGYGNLVLSYSQEREPLGTAGALRLALPHIAEPLWLVMNGDSYVDTDLRAFLAWHRDRQFPGSMLLAWVKDAGRFGTVEVGPAGVIQGFQEKRGQAVPGWINAGVYLLSRWLLESMPPAQVLSLEQDIFPQWLYLGLGGFCTRSSFIDIGTPESFGQAESFLAEMGR